MRLLIFIIPVALVVLFYCIFLFYRLVRAAEKIAIYLRDRQNAKGWK